MCYDIKILILFVTDLPSYKLVIFYSYVKVYQRVAMENDPCVDDLPIMAVFHDNVWAIIMCSSSDITHPSTMD